MKYCVPLHVRHKEDLRVPIADNIYREGLELVDAQRSRTHNEGTHSLLHYMPTEPIAQILQLEE